MLVSGKEANNDDLVIMLIVFGMIVGLIWGSWMLFQDQIIWVLRYVRWAEMAAFEPFVPRDSELVRWYAYLHPDNTSIDLSALEFRHVAAMSEVAGSYWRYPAGAILILMTIVTLFRGPGARFHMRHSLESLIRAQAQAWPVISPIVGFNPAEANARAPGQAVPATLPPFAESLAPEEWIAFHAIPMVEGVPAAGPAGEAFARQLGPRWKGPGDLPVHLQALFAAFALKGARRRSEADEMLGRISACYTMAGGLRLTPALRNEINAILANPKLGGEAVKVARRHAYRAPAMVGLLMWARKRGGVLAPAQFLWLRGEDRAMWYPLNNAGRQSFHPEGAGALGHYAAEIRVGRPLLKPKVEAPVASLIRHVREHNLPIPELQGAPRKAAA